MTRSRSPSAIGCMISPVPACMWLMSGSLKLRLPPGDFGVCATQIVPVERGYVGSLSCLPARRRKPERIGGCGRGYTQQLRLALELLEHLGHGLFADGDPAAQATHGIDLSG